MCALDAEIAGRMVELTEHAGLSRETIRRRLHENALKPWQRKMWCIAKVDAEYVARMEDVLDLYAATLIFALDNRCICMYDGSHETSITSLLLRDTTAGRPSRDGAV
jgi:hypothetical protein